MEISLLKYPSEFIVNYTFFANLEISMGNLWQIYQIVSFPAIFQVWQVSVL